MNKAGKMGAFVIASTIKIKLKKDHVNSDYQEQLWKHLYYASLANIKINLPS